MAIAPLLIALTLWTGVIVWKYALLAYNEELFEKLLEKTRSIINKFPEHRIWFWNKRVDWLIDILPKKAFIWEVAEYSKAEIEYFSKQIQEFYDDLIKEIGTLSRELSNELLKELRNLLTPLKEHAEKVWWVVSWFADQIRQRLWLKQDWADEEANDNSEDK